RAVKPDNRGYGKSFGTLVARELMTQNHRQDIREDPANPHRPRTMIVQQDPNKQQENQNFCEDTANSNKPMMEPDLQSQNLDFCEDAGKSNIPQKVLDCCDKQRRSN
ncbi:MAG: hypothetical protein GY820_10355, partial [Gammaproteobacteria bacterium]|nr:hypothetical protein [Gammaproteobacteria bacterium]